MEQTNELQCAMACTRKLLAAAIGCALGGAALAAPNYNVNKVLVAEDQYQGERGLSPSSIYKPHEVVISQRPSLWVASNERAGAAGITVFKGDRRVLAVVNIEEPGLEFAEEPEEEDIGNEEEEGGEVENFPPEVRLNPTVCLPIRLPPGAPVPVLTEGKGKRQVTHELASFDANHVCAPLGAEMHPRHPHGIDLDRRRDRLVQVIEHSGLKWNADRSGFAIAETTDEEAAALLVYNLTDPEHPVVVTGYLLGHGGHEVAVNENNGKIFQGNHEDSPGVTPNIWVDVIDPYLPNPYGFIDTGWYNAVQGIEVNERLNVVFGTTHVGEKMFAFDGDCAPTPNPVPTAEKQSGANCILYTVDLRAPFLAQVPEAGQLFEIADSDPGVGESVLPSVLHLHDLTVDPVHHRAYQTVHGIDHAEHTGSPEEAALVEPRTPPGQAKKGESEGEEDEEEGQHFQGRWVAEVDVDPASAEFGKVTYIDLSNGQPVLEVPGAEDLPAGTPFAAQFVHAHWVAVDPVRGAVLVTGEHTGNLGVVDRVSRELTQVLGISVAIPGCEPPLDEDGNPEPQEPHVHGVQVNAQTGDVYVSDEGEDCFYESVTYLKP